MSFFLESKKSDKLQNSEDDKKLGENNDSTISLPDVFSDGFSSGKRTFCALQRY